MTLFISDKNVETCKSRTEILANFYMYMKWPWQNGSTLASHAIGPGFEIWAWQRHLFCCQTLQNLTKIWRPRCQLCHFQLYLSG